VVAIPAELEQQLSDIRLRREQHEENCFRGHRRKDRDAAAIFEDRGQQFRPSYGSPQLVCRTHNWRDERGNTFRVDARHRLTIDEQSVAPEHDRCLDPFALSDRSYEIPDAGQLQFLPASGGEARDREIRSQALIIA